MPVIYPQAQLEFQPEPALDLVQDDIALFFPAETSDVSFNPEPAMAFDFSPYIVELVPVDGASLYNEDTGAFLFNEDTGQSFFAEEAT